MKTAHVRDYLLNEQDFLSLLHGCRDQWFRVHMPELPAGAAVVNVYYNWLRMCFVLRVEHHSFPLVPWGDEVPRAGEIIIEARRPAPHELMPDAPLIKDFPP